MVYKLISEWKGIEELGEHEITVFKYNISHDEVVRYNLDEEGNLTVKHYYTCGTPNKETIYKRMN